MSDILGSNVIAVRTPDSITGGVTDNPLDFYKPFTFTEWVVRTQSTETDSAYLLNQYKFYLLSWHKAKKIDKKEVNDFVRSSFINLLKEIVLSYSTLEERRFITNIDFTNDLDLYSVLPFFVSKIKTICNYYSILRENVKFKKYENNLKGSEGGVLTVITNEIIKSLNSLDIIKTDNIIFNLSAIKSGISVEIKEYYDDSQYFDLNPDLPQTSYNPTFSASFYKANLNSFSPKLFTEFESTIIDAIREYPFFLENYSTAYSVNIQVAATDLQYLKDRDFISQINNLDQSNLNLNLEKDLIQKFIGTDYYYLSVGETITDVTSGLLFKCEDKAANFLNKRFPSTATVLNESSLKTAREIGGFFLPDKLGVLNFNTLKYDVSVDPDKLTPGKIYVFPDPSRYGNISGLSRTDFETPFIYEEDVKWMHYDRSAEYIFGNIKSNPLLKTFYAYHSKSETIGYQPFGMSRDIDSTEFFTGSSKTTWANSDVFPAKESVLPLDERQDNLLVVNKTVVKYRNDIYGNNYGLYKEINPVGIGPDGSNSGDFISQNELDFYNFTGGRGGMLGTGRRGITYNQFLELKEQRQKPCLILDGHVFFDLEYGFAFDYKKVDPEKRYSGVYTRTVTQMPPGSGYYTNWTERKFSGGTFTNTLVNYEFSYPYIPPPTFNPLPLPFLLISYGKGKFIPDEFCDVFTVSYCLVLDAITFLNPLSAPLQDVSSDLVSWNTSIPVYYNELLEGSLTQFLTKPNNVDRPTFSYTFPLSTGRIEELNAYKFNMAGQTPCVVSNDNSPDPQSEYNYDLSDFVNFNDDQNVTTVQSLSTKLIGKKSIYQSRYEAPGEMYFKNANTSKVDTLVDALSASINKYPQVVIDDIRNAIFDFELIYNIIFLESENYFVIEKIDFNYETNNPAPFNSDRTFLKIFSNNKQLEKISPLFFNENTNYVYFVKTVLFNNDCTNTKILYPEIYQISIANPILEKIYPNFEITEENLRDYIHLDANTNIEYINKPILKFNDDSKTFVINYFGKNPNYIFFNFIHEFSIRNGKVEFLSHKCYKPTYYINDYNFCQTYDLSSLRGSTLAGGASAIQGDGILYFGTTVIPEIFGSKYEKCDYVVPQITPQPTPSFTPTNTPTVTPSYTPPPAALPVCIVINGDIYRNVAGEPLDHYFFDNGFALRALMHSNGTNLIITNQDGVTEVLPEGWYIITNNGNYANNRLTVLASNLSPDPYVIPTTGWNNSYIVEYTICVTATPTPTCTLTPTPTKP
jgi:hypothetical protein